MGVTFDEGAKKVTFTGITGGATQRNVRLVGDLAAPSGFNDTLFLSGANEFTGLVLNYGNGAYDAGKFHFQVFFSTTNGSWYTTNDVLINGVNEIYITYDGGSTANDPVFYHNGVSVAVTRRVAPAGTIKTDASIDAIIGAPTNPTSPKGTILAVNYITGRIVPLSEVVEAYASRLAIPNRNGLVFCPHLSGAAGLQTFDGATLGADNKIVDTISGALGTPAGSPVGAADSYLTY